MASDGIILFDISLDLGKIKTSIDEASHKIESKLNKAFTNSAEKCEKSCDEMAESLHKINSSADETSVATR